VSVIGASLDDDTDTDAGAIFQLESVLVHYSWLTNKHVVILFSFIGSVYVYGSVGNVWSRQAKLLAADGSAYDVFGSAVALYGNTAIVGAYNDDDRGTDSGIYILVCTFIAVFKFIIQNNYQALFTFSTKWDQLPYRPLLLPSYHLLVRLYSLLHFRHFVPLCLYQMLLCVIWWHLQIWAQKRM
jgi:hypothetical protein